MEKLKNCSMCNLSDKEIELKYVFHLNRLLCPKCTIDILKEIVSLFDRSKIYDNGVSYKYGLLTINYDSKISYLL